MTDASAEPPPDAGAEAQAERLAIADAIVGRNTLWALAGGVMPLPVFDMIAGMSIQLKMLKELSDLYEVPFREALAKKIIGSWMSSLGGTALGVVIAGSVIKVVPFVGSALGIVTVPLLLGASTRATGRVFTLHFESGRTLLDFDPVKLRAHFKREFAAAEIAVQGMKPPLG